MRISGILGLFVCLYTVTEAFEYFQPRYRNSYYRYPWFYDNNGGDYKDVSPFRQTYSRYRPEHRGYGETPYERVEHTNEQSYERRPNPESEPEWQNRAEYSHPGNDDLLTNQDNVYGMREDKTESTTEHTKMTAPQVKEDCMKMMKEKHMKRSMSSSDMEESCRTYSQWGQRISRGMEWNPSDKTMTWWNSLAMDSNKRTRSKRQTRQLRQRKEYRALSDEERQRFHNAVRQLKEDEMDGMSKYDVFVMFHQPAAAPAAHFGPAFLPWHREYILRFENALLEIDPEVALPYWDSNLDNHISNNAVDTALWTPDFMGNGNGDVTTGPFAFWRLPVQAGADRPFLHRDLGTPPAQSRAPPRLMSDEAIQMLLNSRSMREVSWFVDPSFESAHGSVHNWVSGVMGDLSLSPSDPIFFLHHAYIDCLWEEMRDVHRGRFNVDVRYDYPNDSTALGVGQALPDGRRIRQARESDHHAEAPMAPFSPIRNIDGLSEEYTTSVYQCAPRPSCSASDTSCDGAPNLFCDTRSYRCVPKLRLQASCGEYGDHDSCYKGVCCRGTCSESCETVESPRIPEQPIPEERDFEEREYRPERPARFPARHPVAAPTHPPEYFRRHNELERRAFSLH